MALSPAIHSIAIWTVVCAAAFLVYALAGYPLLLGLWARLRPAPPVQARFEPAPVSVLIPVHNGERFLRRKLDSILALDYPRDLIEVIVVSDGSSDGTDLIASEFRDCGVRLLRVPRAGKAAALNAGIAQAAGEILFLTDVRQPLAPDALRCLVACFADPSVGAACGELIIYDGLTREETDVGLYWRYEKWIRRQLNRAGSLLVVTGCIFALRRSLAVPIPADMLIDDAFLPLHIVTRGYRIVFEQNARAYDYPTASATEFNRKIRTLAGLYQLVRRTPRLLLPFPSAMFHFWSYKLSRLFMPHALILLAFASFLLPRPWAELFVGAQALFYGLALANPLIPQGVILKRLSSPAFTFSILMAASLCAMSVLIVDPRRLWKVSRVGVPAASAARSGR